jgi:hypothetical protein
VVLFTLDEYKIVTRSRKPHYCSTQDHLTQFLESIGLSENDLEGIMAEMESKGSTSRQLSLSQDQIELF